MLTFKQFLTEDPLLDLRAELFLQQKFGLDKAERKVALAWVNGEIGDIDTDHPELWQKLYSYYSVEIPYDVAKGYARDFETHDWVYETVLHDLKDAGIKVRFQPDGARPRTSSDQAPRNKYGSRDYDY